MAERSGEVISKDSLEEIFVKTFNDGHLIFIDGILGGIDARLQKLWPLRTFSLGNFELSNGRALWSIIWDYVDRTIFFKESQTVFWDHYPNKFFGRPATYKNLKVPAIIRSGDHNKILNYLKENEDIDSWIS